MKVEQLPGGAAWLAEVESIPQAVRHIRLHENHFLSVNERDRGLVSNETVTAFTWTGNTTQLRERFEQYEAQGATEIFFQPTGPEIPRELTAFARAAGLSRDTAA